jgi:Cu-Zn family superoxide dismutase
MPPLFGNNGSAWMMYSTDRFTIPEIIGKTVIIHSGIDDFSTQPSGNSGAKIACGAIQAV